MRIRVLLVLAVLVLLAPAAPAASATPTVGDFLVQIARTSGLTVAGAGDAAAALASRGVALPAVSPSKPLTEGDVVAIGRSLGLSIRTSRPEAAFGDGQVTRFLRTFAGTLPGKGDGASTRGEDPGPYPRPDGAADPLSKGKGKKKGIDISPTDPVL